MSETTPHMSQEIRKQMESICRQATAGRDDTARVGDELFGHLEDKFLAYLRGDERLTEADAMILVREHFGRPENLCEMLGRDVHKASAVENLIPWRRRMLVIALATIAIYNGAFVLRSLAVDAPIVAALKRDGTVSAKWATGGQLIGSLVSSFIVAGVLFGVFRRWRRLEDAGEVGWMMRWSTLRIASWIVALAAVLQVIECLLHHWYFSFQKSAIFGEELPLQYVIPMGWARLVVMHVPCLIWIVWVAWRRPWWIGVIAAGGFFAFLVLGRAIYVTTAILVSSDGFFLSPFPMLHLPASAIFVCNSLIVFLTFRFAAWVSRQLAFLGVRPLFSR